MNAEYLHAQLENVFKVALLKKLWIFLKIFTGTSMNSFKILSHFSKLKISIMLFNSVPNKLFDKTFLITWKC